ncbi:MAG TPA: Os1348 family NHLP clan protein [Herpetosiphonaceae bacterium]|nr:Os1348 family NHLP clan protein [Herpetosiphonaceae bacterium]
MSVSLAHVIHRVTTDTQFRTQLMADPQAALKAHKLSLNDEEWAALLEVTGLFTPRSRALAYTGPVVGSTSSWPGGASFTSSALVQPT